MHWQVILHFHQNQLDSPETFLQLDGYSLARQVGPKLIAVVTMSHYLRANAISSTRMQITTNVVTSSFSVASSDFPPYRTWHCCTAASSEDINFCLASLSDIASLLSSLLRWRPKSRWVFQTVWASHKLSSINHWPLFSNRLGSQVYITSPRGLRRTMDENRQRSETPPKIRYQFSPERKFSNLTRKNKKTAALLFWRFWNSSDRSVTKSYNCNI